MVPKAGIKRWLIHHAINFENAAYLVAEWATRVRQRIEYDERDKWVIRRLRDIGHEAKRWPKWVREQRLK